MPSLEVSSLLPPLIDGSSVFLCSYTDSQEARLSFSNRINFSHYKASSIYYRKPGFKPFVLVKVHVYYPHNHYSPANSMHSERFRN